MFNKLKNNIKKTRDNIMGSSNSRKLIGDLVTDALLIFGGATMLCSGFLIVKLLGFLALMEALGDLEAFRIREAKNSTQKNEL